MTGIVQTPERAAVRMGDWKLIMNGSEKIDDALPETAVELNSAANRKANSQEKYELYNLAVDISESHDLSAKEPERLATMRATLKELLSGQSHQVIWSTQSNLPLVLMHLGSIDEQATCSASITPRYGRMSCFPQRVAG